jgi:hypothetical protein
MYKSLNLAVVCFFAMVIPAMSFSQDDRVVINKSLIPATADNVNQFVPAGWKIEEQLSGDLNGDGAPDYALKLIEDKPAKDKDDNTTQRYRAVVIVLKNADGKLTRAGVADKLLQCTQCGGAFYGVVEAPANVKIEKGVIVVDQDHGSRDLANTTYRFRYDPETQRFVLIGFDYADADRATGTVNSESTNYLTGARIVMKGKGKRDATTRSQIPKKKVFLEDVDYEKFEEEAGQRLGLN